MTNTIPNVPRELLDSLLTVIESNGYAADEVEVVDELRVLLSAPSPAGVDGLEVIGYLLTKGNQLSRMSAGAADEPLCRLSDAQAIIDGLRARCFSLVMNCAAELETASYCMTDEEAKRIAQSGADYYRKEARLSAGKEGD